MCEGRSESDLGRNRRIKGGKRRRIGNILAVSHGRLPDSLLWLGRRPIWYIGGGRPCGHRSGETNIEQKVIKRNLLIEPEAIARKGSICSRNPLPSLWPAESHCGATPVRRPIAAGEWKPLLLFKLFRGPSGAAQAALAVRTRPTFPRRGFRSVPCRVRDEIAQCDRHDIDQQAALFQLRATRRHRVRRSGCSRNQSARRRQMDDEIVELMRGTRDR